MLLLHYIHFGNTFRKYTHLIRRNLLVHRLVTAHSPGTTEEQTKKNRWMYVTEVDKTQRGLGGISTFMVVGQSHDSIYQQREKSIMYTRPRYITYHLRSPLRMFAVWQQNKYYVFTKNYIFIFENCLCLPNCKAISIENELVLGASSVMISLWPTHW